MRIALASSDEPFKSSRGQSTRELLRQVLMLAGHQVDEMSLPFVPRVDSAMAQLFGIRLLNISRAADVLIAFPYAAMFLRHPNKTLWLDDEVSTSVFDPGPDMSGIETARDSTLDRLRQAERVVAAEAGQVIRSALCTSRSTALERESTFQVITDEDLRNGLEDPHSLVGILAKLGLPGEQSIRLKGVAA